jgi:hypothetical protein
VTTVAWDNQTLLKAPIRERRLTATEVLDLLHRRARETNEHGFALSERQLRRWMAGDVASLDSARPANVRVLEEEFGRPIAALLAIEARSKTAVSPAGGPGAKPELRTGEFVAWLAAHSNVSFEDAYDRVVTAAEHLASRPPALRHGTAIPAVRSQLVEAVTAYYGDPAGLYRAKVDSVAVELSILSEPRWVGQSIPLGTVAEHCELADTQSDVDVHLNDHHVDVAIERLAAAETDGTMLANNPLYRLTGLEISAAGLNAQFSCSDFATYALTSDLLEAELATAATARSSGAASVATPLRAMWLPSAQAALAFDRRVCVGGPVCLVAVCFGAGYYLLIQERSSKVLNGIGTIAVIPKAFHQPTVDAFDETSLSLTVEREMEEELLGRIDLELLGPHTGRRAAPMHPQNASSPMRWLHGHRDAWRMECTGFGVNLVTGNFEFACLIAVHDPKWWADYGHLLAANWEASHLKRYSSVDCNGLRRLINDSRWSNEALFAFIEGLRRLAEVDPERVESPVLEVML